jgi:steroid 5-alpha reductase family enzyme
LSLTQLFVLSACAALALAIIMAGAWRLREMTGNSGWVDVCWSLGVGAVAVLGTIAPLDAAAPWPHWRQFLVAALAGAWSMRLGLHILARTRAASDDPRYRHMAAQWKTAASRRMFWFLQAQAGVGIVLVVCVALAGRNPAPDLRLQDILGALLIVAALFGEYVSDVQLRRFRAHPGHRNGICNVGLWRWSRHPNYFFEWVGWLAYPVFAADLSGRYSIGWAAALAPICMYWVLVYASGIPLLEAHMLRTRGEAFRNYERRTPRFFPIPRRPR